MPSSPSSQRAGVKPRLDVSRPTGSTSAARSAVRTLNNTVTSYPDGASVVAESAGGADGARHVQSERPLGAYAGVLPDASGPPAQQGS